MVTGVRRSLDQPAEVVRVYPDELVDAASGSELPPMAGRTEVDPAGIRFVPRFGFSPGGTYRVLVGSGSGPPRQFTLTRGRPTADERRRGWKRCIPRPGASRATSSACTSGSPPR